MTNQHRTMHSRFAPPIEDVAELLKTKLGVQNHGELMSELYRQLGEDKLVQLIFVRPHIVFKGSSTLAILLTEERGNITADLICSDSTAYYASDGGNQNYRKEAEQILRDLGFTGENNNEENEENGLLSAVKNWWRKDEQ